MPSQIAYGSSNIGGKIFILSNVCNLVALASSCTATVVVPEATTVVVAAVPKMSHSGIHVLSFL